MTPSSSLPPVSEDPEVIVHVHGATDVGHTREHNEDNFLVVDLERGQPLSNADSSESVRVGKHGMLFCIADGLGGAASGEIASAMAVKTIMEDVVTNWNKRTTLDSDSFAESLRDATEMANSRIHAFAKENLDHRGMGTTSTVAGLFRDSLYIAQIGDSRAYLFRDGTLRLLTRDQSLMQRLVDAGEISQEQAENSDRRNIILQALGPEESIKIDLTQQKLRHGDLLIVCSDGLSSVAKAHEIEEVARSAHDPAVLCHTLIALANSLGGPDNITVIAARFEGSGLSEPQPADEVGHKIYPLKGTLGEDTIPVFQDEPVEPIRPSIISDNLNKFSGNTAPISSNFDSPARRADFEHRRAKAKPVMMALVVLGTGAVVWMLWQLFQGIS